MLTDETFLEEYRIRGFITGTLQSKSMSKTWDNKEDEP